MTFLMLILRTLLFGIGYFAFSGILFFLNQPNYFETARAWWPIYGIVLNIIGFTILYFAVHKDKKIVFSLIGYQSEKRKKDLLTGLGLTLISMVVAFGSTMIPGLLLYGVHMPSSLMSLVSLPLWAKIIGIGIFPLMNSIVEELTYNGYVFPKLEKSFHNKWITLVVVLFFFTLQHIFIPFAFDLKFLWWRFISFVPLLLLWIIIYMKMRRLTSLFMIHWIMDIFAISSILFVPLV